MRTLFLSICTLFIATGTFAHPEERSSQLAAEGEQSSNLLPLEYPNIAKINVSSLAVSTVSLQYERILGQKTSVAAGLRFTIKSALPFKGALMDLIADDGDHEADIRNAVDEARKSGFAFTPEFRYYFGKAAGKGMYIAPFARYEHFSFVSPYRYLQDGEQKVVQGRVSLNTFGIGLMLGAQFRLSEHFTLDWWILGPYYTRNNLGLHASGLNLNTAQQQDVEDFFNDVEVLWIKPNVVVTDRQVSAEARFGAVGIRAFGLCIGYRF